MRNYHWAPITPNYSALEMIFADELQPLGLPVGWMGSATTPETGPRSNATASGVWWHDLPNGRVYWNPRGNGAQLVTADVSMHRIPHNGYGDNTVNTGASVPSGSTFTLQLPDGRTTVDSRFVLRDSDALSSKTKRAS